MSEIILTVQEPEEIELSAEERAIIEAISPTANVTKTGDTATITITDKDGTTTASISDGYDGQDGYSPTATVTKVGGTATITITDKNGTTTANISDGSGAVTGVQMNGSDIPIDQNGIVNLGTVVTSKSDKADKVTGATSGNFAGLDGNGNLTDSGHKHSDYLTSHQDISGKADKVSSAVSGNFAGLDGNGNLTDSGSKAGDFLTSHQDISGKADKVTGGTTDNFAALDSNGNLKDSGHKHSDYLTAHQDISGKADKVSSATSGDFAGLDGNGNLTDSGKSAADFVASNQGAGNAGKALGIANDGSVTPVPFSGEDFTGATSSAAGTHGYVPAPAAGQNAIYYLKGDGTWSIPPGAKMITVDLDTVTNVSGSYSHATTASDVAADMKPVLIELSDPSVFRSVITVTPSDGSITLSCSNVVGTSTVKVSLMFVAGPNTLTSSEFDVLAGRIGTLSSLTTTAKTNIVAAVNELDSDIGSLSDHITTIDTSTTFTDSTTGWGAKRWGNVVNFRLQSDFSSDYNDGTTILYIPTGFRPTQTNDCQVFSTSGVYLGTVRFNTDGVVSPVFGKLKAGSIRMNITYIWKEWS